MVAVNAEVTKPEPRTKMGMRAGCASAIEQESEPGFVDTMIQIGPNTIE